MENAEQKGKVLLGELPDLLKYKPEIGWKFAQN